MATEITPIQEVQGTLAKMSDQFKMSLPKHINPDKFIRAAQTAIQNTPDLLALSRPSLYNSLLKCAQDGLLPDGREAVITKKGGDAVYMPMIGGILKLIRNSGELATIDAEVVHEKDEYDSWTDEKGPHFRFKKARVADRGAVIATFAYAVMKDGATYFEEIGNDEMAGIQNSAGTQFVWKGPFREEMMKKSALRRMSKRMSKSTDIEEVFKHDDENFDLEKPVDTDTAPTTSSKLSDAITGKSEPKPETANVRPEAVDADVVQPAATQPTPDPVVPSPVNTPTGTVLKAVLFDKISAKDGTTNGKAWKKFGIKVGDQWYGTFDTKIADQAQEAIQGNKLMNLKFTDTVKGDQTFHNIISIEQADLADVQDAGQMPEDEVPI